MILTLQSAAEIQQSRSQLRERGVDFSQPSRARLWRWVYALRFRRHLAPADVKKSWDVATAAKLIEEHMPDRSAPVLDMGCYGSEILWVLHELGYRKLYGCDLN